MKKKSLEISYLFFYFRLRYLLKLRRQLFARSRFRERRLYVSRGLLRFFSPQENETLFLLFKYFKYTTLSVFGSKITTLLITRESSKEGKKVEGKTSNRRNRVRVRVRR
jgi:hypothetical protein